MNEPAPSRARGRRIALVVVVVLLCVSLLAFVLAALGEWDDPSSRRDLNLFWTNPQVVDTAAVVSVILVVFLGCVAARDWWLTAGAGAAVLLTFVAVWPSPLLYVDPADVVSAPLGVSALVRVRDRVAPWRGPERAARRRDWVATDAAAHALGSAIVARDWRSVCRKVGAPVLRAHGSCVARAARVLRRPLGETLQQVDTFDIGREGDMLSVDAWRDDGFSIFGDSPKYQANLTLQWRGGSLVIRHIAGVF
jgi:hypothetical protein